MEQDRATGTDLYPGHRFDVILRVPIAAKRGQGVFCDVVLPVPVFVAGETPLGQGLRAKGVFSNVALFAIAIAIAVAAEGLPVACLRRQGRQGARMDKAEGRSLPVLVLVVGGGAQYLFLQLFAWVVVEPKKPGFHLHSNSLSGTMQARGQTYPAWLGIRAGLSLSARGDQARFEPDHPFFLY